MKYLKSKKSRVNSKAQVSLTRSFIFALVSLFGIGIYSYFLVDYAFLKIKVTFTNILSNSTISAGTKALIISRYDQLYLIMKFLPLAFLFIIVVWLLIIIFRREADTGY